MEVWWANIGRDKKG